MYPALTVLQALTNNPVSHSAEPSSGEPGATLDVLWVGGVGGMEFELVKRAGVPFETIPAAGVHGVGLRALPGNIMQLLRGYRQAGQILRRFQPDVLFFTGGYIAVPMALAGRRLPKVLYVPDIEPGLALKTLARFADQIAVTAEESKAYFVQRSKVVVTGYPVRPDLRTWTRSEAQKVLGLVEDLPTLLVFGGSKGSRSINRALLDALPALLPEMQIVHISGQLDWAEVEAAYLRLPQKLADAALARRYRVFPYLHSEMGAAFAAADLVLARAGASMLGECPLFGLPAILAPYPHAWRYQQVNAEFLAKRGAAQVVSDADLPTQLLPVVQGLMRDSVKRDQMRQAMLKLACPDAAKSIANLLETLASRSNRIWMEKGS